MAVTDRDPRRTEPAQSSGEGGVGIAHLTVVPTNFDPDDREDDERA